MIPQTIGPESIDVSYLHGTPKVTIRVPEESKTYRCIKKANGIPTSEFDGDMISAKPGAVEDTSVVGGNRYYYLLKDSSDNEYIAGPVEVYPPVSSYNMTVAPDFISVAYMHPAGSDTVELYKTYGDESPRRIYTSSAEGLVLYVDRDVSPDVECTYHLKAMYGGSCSEYTNFSGKLVKYPDPIPLRIIDKVADTVTLESLSNPEFDVYFSEEKLEDGSIMAGIPPGVKQLSLGSDGRGNLTADVEEGKSGYLYPLLMKGDMVVVGYGSSVSTYKDIYNVQFSIRPETVQVNMDYPDDITGILCMYNRSRMPTGPDDRDSIAMHVQKNVLDAKQNSFEFKMNYSRAYVKIYCLYPNDGYSDGYEKVIVRNNTIIRYRFRDGRKPVIEFSTEDDIDAVPPTMVRENSFGRPRSRTTGNLVAELPEVPLTKGKGTVEYVPGQFDPENSALFFAETGDIGIRLICDN